MAYNIYTTPAFLVSSFEHGEADKFYKIYTRDLGMVNVTAKGIRKQDSKLGMHLLEFRKINLSLVRGKEVWRATSATVELLYEGVISNVKKRTAYGRIISLVARLIPGEENHLIVFNALSYCFLALNTQKTENILAIESITLIRILYYLGYIKKDDTISKYINDEEITEELSDLAVKEKSALLSHINHALKESQL
ncbi:MAG: recombination protein O N-terminal domain-containing protein [bacterium]|nr:recombination protein O N-terminal domain-containing protein [bacterium]